MAKKNLSPLVQAINLFNILLPGDKLTLAEYIKSQTASPRASKPIPRCIACGYAQASIRHNEKYKDSPDYHPFAWSTDAPSAERKSSRKKSEQPSNPSTDVKEMGFMTAPYPCGVCGNEPDYQDHFKPAPNYHEFVGKKSKVA